MQGHQEDFNFLGGRCGDRGTGNVLSDINTDSPNPLGPKVWAFWIEVHVGIVPLHLEDSCRKWICLCLWYYLIDQHDVRFGSSYFKQQAVPFVDQLVSISIQYL